MLKGNFKEDNIMNSKNDDVVVADNQELIVPYNDLMTHKKISLVLHKQIIDYIKLKFTFFSFLGNNKKGLSVFSHPPQTRPLLLFPLVNVINP